MAAKPKAPDIFLVSIDGTRAPAFEHPTVEAAMAEAERLAQELYRQGQPHAKIRVVKQIGTLSVKIEKKVTTNWS